MTELPIAAVELLWGMRLTRKFIAALVVGVAIVALIFPLLLWSDRLGGAAGKGRNAALVPGITAG